MQNNEDKDFVSFKGSSELSLMINILKCIGVAYAITIVIFIGYALLLTYTDMTEKQMPIVVIATTVISVVIAGIDIAKSVNSKGWLWGMTVGLIYAVIIVIIGIISTKGNIQIEFSTVAMIIMCIAGGGLGGMIGINKKR